MSRRIRSRLTGLALGLSLVTPGVTEERFTVRAQLEPSSGVAEDTALRLVLQVQGTSNPRVTPPRLPKLLNLSVVNGPSSRTNIAWINGATTATVELVWTLMPERAGAAEVPALEVHVEDQVYRTAPLRIDVLRAGPRAKAQPRAPGAGRGGAATANAEAIRLAARLGADTVWVGEPVPLDVTLYTQPRVTGFDWQRQPDFASFWVEPVEFDPDAEVSRVRLDDQAYLAYPVERKILVAPGPGTYEIEPYVAQIQARLGREDPFDWFRQLGRTEAVLRKTEPLRLVVRPLPQAGRPPGFSGSVGSYTLTAALDRNEARVDDAVALRATVRGSGSLRSAAPPVLELPLDVKAFDPQVKESSLRTAAGRITSSKTWEWILVPRSPGEIRLPELRFDYFDPAAGNYATAKAGGLALTVRRGERGSDVALTQTGIQVQRRELAFVKPLRGRLHEAHPRAHQRAAFRLLFVLPWIAVPALVLFGRRRARLERDQGFARARRARTRARKRLAAIRRQLEQLDSAAFHEQVARTLVDYLADRTGCAAAGLTYDRADEHLGARGVDPQLRQRFRACLEACDFVRFVPDASRPERRLEILDEAAKLVEELERAW